MRKVHLDNDSQKRSRKKDDGGNNSGLEEQRIYPPLGAVDVARAAKSRSQTRPLLLKENNKNKQAGGD